MKVLGISGSQRKDHTSGKLVKIILDATGLTTEFISLAGEKINGCICCLGCINDNVCKEQDDYVTDNKQSKECRRDCYRRTELFRKT